MERVFKYNLIWIVLLLCSAVKAQSTDSWVNFAVQYDWWAPQESNFTFVSDANGDTVFYHEPTLPYEYLDTTIFINSSDYIVTLNDSFGDGWYSGDLAFFKMSNDCQGLIINFDPLTQQFFTLDTLVNILPCAPPVMGCIDENATNFNSDATVSDNSCTYPLCEGWGEPFATQTCDGGQALLYYEWETSDNPNCNVIQIIYGGEGTNTYTFDVDIDNGIWGVYVGNGQMPPNWEEEYSFQVMYADSTLSDTFVYTPYPCTQGCTDNGAPNYNPWANVDDGSCGGQACDAGYTPVTIEVTLDNWPGETGWSFVSGDGSMEVPSGDYSYQDVGQTFTYNVCAMEGGFEFIVSDTYGDGLAGSTSGGELDGDIVIRGCDGEIITQLSNGDWVNGNQELTGVGFGSVAYSTWQQSTICEAEEVLGCTDPGYQEFSSEANIDDGTCLIEHTYGCIEEGAYNYDDSATAMEIYPNCNYELWIGDAGADGWGNSFLGVVQGDNIWSYTMGPGEYEQTFPIWLETDKPVKIFYFEVGGAQTPAEEVAFQTLHNSFKLTNVNGDILLYEGWNPFADNGQGALQPFEPPFFQTYQAMPFCGTLCIPTVEGCLDSTALNYNEEVNTDDGSCVEIIEGCTNELAFNYDVEANYDNGSCEAVVVGCMDTIAWNYNDSANTDGGDCIYLGCTDDTACNYNSNANADSGGCTYPDDYYDCSDICINDTDSDGICDELEIGGCTNPLSINYDIEATDDDSSCIAFIYGCTDPTAFNYSEIANTDNGSCEPIIFGCIDNTATNFDGDANTDNDSCIPYIYGCTDSAALNYNEEANTEDGSCVDIVYGCTDDSALNYNELANTDNGSCIAIVEGCTDSTALNYDEDANVDDFSCIAYIYGCTDSSALNYNELANTDNGSCIAVVEGCTNPIALNYNVDANVDDFSCVLPIYGCTDSEAFNYNELANVDNESCIEVVLGCTNSDALNYDSVANTDDGSCITPIYGCMDDTMFNYNPLANVDNGSCEPFVYGCNDDTAYNYDILANTSNNSCCYIAGCTDSTALNYDLNACYDDGSCIVIIEGCADPDAYNYNPLVNVPDDTTCLYDAGCIGAPGEPYWLNDPCYAWVIDIDSYCCTELWDETCQSMYNYCEDGWPVNIDELSGSDIVVYPNPTANTFTIETRLDVNVELYNMIGELIEVDNNKRIDLSDYPDGIYNLIITYDKIRITKKVIKL